MSDHTPLRALILGGGEPLAMKALASLRPSLLFHIADKPLVDHLIEQLAGIGIRKLDFLLHHFPEQIEARIEDGKRWGVEIRTHLLKDPHHPFRLIASLAREWKDDKVLICTDRTLLRLVNSDFKVGADSLSFDFFSGEWSGWACVGAEKLRKIPASARMEQLTDHLSSNVKVKVSHSLNVGTYQELAKANADALSQDDSFVIFPASAKNVETGVWISRGVVIEPGVQVIPPVFIGEYSQIKAGAMIGPNAVIENHCIIDNDSTVQDALVCQNSYVGEFLEVKHSIVDRNCLINIQYDTEMNIKEAFILSAAAPPSVFQGVVNLFERCAALCIFILCLPIYIYLKLTSKMILEDKISLPSHGDKQDWRIVRLSYFRSENPGFLHRNFYWLPHLINIVKGNFHFVGVPPRSIDETAQMPPEWQRVYLKSKAGLITLCDVEHGPSPSEDEKYASEAFYSVQQGFIFDLKTLSKWIWKTMKRKIYAA